MIRSALIVVTVVAAGCGRAEEREVRSTTRETTSQRTTTQETTPPEEAHAREWVACSENHGLPVRAEESFPCSED